MIERFLNHKSYNEILDIMSGIEKGVSLQTVKNRIFRGRKIIRKQLQNTRNFLQRWQIHTYRIKLLPDVL